MVIFHGYDCATKTLAWCTIDVDLDICAKLTAAAEILKTPIDFVELITDATPLLAQLNEISNILANFIKPISGGTVDILNGRKVADCDEITRARALKTFLQTRAPLNDVIDIYGDIPPENIYVVIERQPNRIGMKINAPSTAISHQLGYHYSDNNVSFIQPNEKNKYHVCDDMSFESYKSKFIEAKINRGNLKPLTSAESYAIRKKHCKDNFLCLVERFNLQALINGTPLNLQGHIADAFMQIIAFIVKNNLLKLNLNTNYI